MEKPATVAVIHHLLQISVQAVVALQLVWTMEVVTVVEALVTAVIQEVMAKTTVKAVVTRQQDHMEDQVLEMMVMEVPKEKHTLVQIPENPLET